MQDYSIVQPTCSRPSPVYKATFAMVLGVIKVSREVELLGVVSTGVSDAVKTITADLLEST